MRQNLRLRSAFRIAVVRQRPQIQDSPVKYLCDHLLAKPAVRQIIDVAMSCRGPASVGLNCTTRLRVDLFCLNQHFEQISYELECCSDPVSIGDVSEAVLVDCDNVFDDLDCDPGSVTHLSSLTILTNFHWWNVQI